MRCFLRRIDARRGIIPDACNIICKRGPAPLLVKFHSQCMTKDRKPRAPDLP